MPRAGTLHNRVFPSNRHSFAWPGAVMFKQAAPAMSDRVDLMSWCHN